MTDICNCSRHQSHDLCLAICPCSGPDQPVVMRGPAEDLAKIKIVSTGAPNINTHDGLKYSLTNQSPIDPKVIEFFEVIRGAAGIYASKLLDVVPDGRAKSIAITKLEESVMWAVKAVALDQQGALDRNESPR